jgi:predicted DNA-binding protein YlxM (UPF0122 family)
MSKYRLEIVRNNGNGSHTIIAKQFLSEDQVIDQLARMVPKVEFAFQVAPEPEQEVTSDTSVKLPENFGQMVEEEEEPEETIEQLNRRGGRRPSYEREAMERDILDGMSVVEVAEKYGVTKANVYTTRNKLKKQGQEPPKAERAAKAPATDSDLPIYYQDILDMLRDDMTSEEIYEKMRYQITDAQFRTAMEWAELQ